MTTRLAEEPWICRPEPKRSRPWMTARVINAMSAPSREGTDAVNTHWVAVDMAQPVSNG